MRGSKEVSADLGSVPIWVNGGNGRQPCWHNGCWGAVASKCAFFHLGAVPRHAERMYLQHACNQHPKHFARYNHRLLGRGSQDGTQNGTLAYGDKGSSVHTLCIKVSVTLGMCQPQFPRLGVTDLDHGYTRVGGIRYAHVTYAMHFHLAFAQGEHIEVPQSSRPSVRLDKSQSTAGLACTGTSDTRGDQVVFSE